MYLGHTGLDFFRGIDFLSPLLFKMVLGMNMAKYEHDMYMPGKDSTAGQACPLYLHHHTVCPSVQ